MNTVIRAQRIQMGEMNAKSLNRVGMAVMVRRDDGSIFHTSIKTLPWQLGGGHWVVGVVGIAGGYDVLKVLPTPEVVP